MKRIIFFLLALISFASFGQLTRNELYNIVARDIKSSGAYSSFKTGKILDSLIQAIALKDSVGSGGSDVFAGDITVVLSGGKTLGRYSSGQTIPSTGKTAEQVLNLIAIEYINPSFTFFNVFGLSNFLEVGTTLSGSKTFQWGTTAGSGTITVIDIRDVTAAVNLATGLSNTGSSSQTITTHQLNSPGASQQWLAIGHDSGGGPTTFNSPTFTVSALYIHWWDAVTTSLTNSASVRALTQSGFQQSGNSFLLNTGTSLTKFVVALPPGTTLASVVDLDALNANITSSWISQANISVLDAGGTARTYAIYEYNVGSPYGSNHRLTLTTN